MDIKRPDHYILKNGEDSIDLIRDILTNEQLEGFYLANIFKYLIRYRNKNGVEDLEKASVYLDWLINLLNTLEVDEINRKKSKSRGDIR